MQVRKRGSGARPTDTNRAGGVREPGCFDQFGATTDGDSERSAEGVPGAKPVIIEDGAFIGSRAIVVEGVRVGAEAVLGANTVLTASTVILDVTGSEPVEMRGFVPPRSVVIPGTRKKKFPAGEYDVPCALIIGRRSESTDKKVSLNAALRDFGVSV